MAIYWGEFSIVMFLNHSRETDFIIRQLCIRPFLCSNVFLLYCCCISCYLLVVSVSLVLWGLFSEHVVCAWVRERERERERESEWVSESGEWEWDRKWERERERKREREREQLLMLTSVYRKWTWKHKETLSKATMTLWVAKPCYTLIYCLHDIVTLNYQ